MCFLVTIRDIIRKVERTETLRNKALLVSGLVEWQFQHHNKATVPFDIYTNLNLEEALEKKQSVKIKIDNENYNADAVLRKAVSEKGNKMVELLRKDLKGEWFYFHRAHLGLAYVQSGICWICCWNLRS